MDDFKSIDIKDLNDLLPKAFDPNWKLLEQTDDEEDFSKAAFHLLQECGGVCAALAGLQTSKTLDRNQAIIYGLAVRLWKLAKVIVRDLSNREPFQQLSFSRQIFETSGTLVYLLHDDGSGSRFDEYILYTLAEERLMLENVKQNIENRDGEVLDIEKRLEGSIIKTAKSAGIDDVSKIPGKKKTGFPIVEERLKLLGSNVYVAYRTGSSEIHGTWSDLLKNHLVEIREGEFVPNADNPPVRPHVATTTTSVLARVFGAYLDYLDIKQITDLLDPRLTQLIEKNDRLVSKHEKFLTKQQ